MSCECITIKTGSSDCECVKIESSSLDEVLSVAVIGPQGPAGAVGVGVPSGGISGYVLTKASNTDYDTEWIENVPVNLSSPPPIGDVTPNTGAFTNLAAVTGSFTTVSAGTVSAGQLTAITGFFTTISASGLATLPHIHGSLAGDIYVHVKNTHGSALSRGTPVYVKGNVGGTDRVEVGAADFDDPTKMPAIGLLDQDLNQNATGDAVILGELPNANTAAYALNTELYVGNAGTLTATRPTTGQVQSVGVVSRVQSNTGVIVVNMQGTRSPNETFAAAIHASTHYTGGSDPIAPSDIGAQSLFTNSAIIVGTSLSAARAVRYAVSNYAGASYDIVLPVSGSQQGDIAVFRSTNQILAPVTIKYVSVPSNITLASLTQVEQQFSFIFNAAASEWNPILVDTHTHTGSQVFVGTTANLPLRTGTDGVITSGAFGTEAGSFCAGDDARLSDDRDPNAHAASHLPDGADEIFDQSLNTSDNVDFETVTANDLVIGTNGLVVRDISSNFEAKIFSAEDFLNANRSYQVPDESGTLALLSNIPASTSKTDVYLSNDTWTKPAGAKRISILLIGGGGGGGAGRRGASSTVRAGGGGGQGGSLVMYEPNPNTFPDTVTVNVGAGGTGGVNSANDTNGADAINGGNTTLVYGAFTLFALGGDRGRGGSTVAGAGGTNSAICVAVYNNAVQRANGGAANIAGSANGGSPSNFAPAGGGGGGSINASNANLNSGAGGSIGVSNILPVPGGSNPPAGSTGNNGQTSYANFSGTGASGGRSDSTIGAAGGVGGLYGGGGGGGSGALNNGGGSTAGGTGGAGIAIITTYF